MVTQSMKIITDPSWRRTMSMDMTLDNLCLDVTMAPEEATPTQISMTLAATRP